VKVAGFRFAGVAAGVKKKGGKDVGLIACDAPVAAAAVFTGNRVKAAPVCCRRRTCAPAAAGCAAWSSTAATPTRAPGPAGAADARTMAAAGAAAIGGKPGEQLVASTGVIGQPLPIDRVTAGIAAAGAALSADGFADFADAILTTDRGPKVARRTVKLGRTAVTLVGCTKGAGMIAPNMATTLSFVCTDAAIAPALLARATRAAVGPTYNSLIVDGDTSTNDTLAVLASGAAGPALSGRAVAGFTAALTELLADLATQLIRDGEGVHHVVTIDVRGAASDRAAAAVARRIATSPLVKTAIAGGDPNWGRVLCAIGNAGVPIDPTRLGLSIGGVAVVKRGAVAPGYDEAAAAAVMQTPAYTITVDLGAAGPRAVPGVRPVATSTCRSTPTTAIR
jgi:glutamate N-acetyltransferase/amino-acid N-acetyltransferase